MSAAKAYRYGVFCFLGGARFLSQSASIENTQPELTTTEPTGEIDSAHRSIEDRLFDTSRADKDLGRRAVRGGAITITTQGFRFLLRTGSTAVLARMLTPEDFGLIAMVTVVVGFTEILNNAGLSAATVQRKEITRAQISTLFWANIVISTTVMLLVAASAPMLSWFYNEPRLVGVTLALSASIIFGGVGIQHQALLRRSMQFGRLAVVEVGGIFAGVVVAIVMASLGFGYWSLVGMTIATSFMTAILSFAMTGWTPGKPTRDSGALEMLKFGVGVSSFTIVNYFSRNCDNFLIGWRWGAGALGVYSKAYGLLLLPTAQISRPAMAAFLPMLCRLQDKPEQFRTVFQQVIRALSFLTMPGMAALVIAADAAVFVFLGPQWDAAVPVFQILGLAAIFECVFSALGQPMIACGKASALYRMGLIGAVPTIGAFFIGLPYGPEGVAAGYTLSNTLVVCPLLFLFVAGQTPIKVFDFYRAISPPFLLAVLVAGIVYGVRYLFDIQSPILVLLVAGICVTPSTILSIQLFRQIRNLQHD
ncbi:lipopolysaccharide biosynthesis protein [Bremerella cremea]|uniref:Lipopolysaccharide biosynthesis protein n=1 Tax=Blastopirellula marina TaxID=124 RepID=A0A2S8FKZ0_9BACT|nr:lipopolysaccharide biosynthesis protein [Blastopirellula marina]RCS45909.1 lipopolysaccharide biosynthesis protein [Bremerella cremea]